MRQITSSQKFETGLLKWLLVLCTFISATKLVVIEVKSLIKIMLGG